ncbi:hypothetical protein N7505_007828 [Penicillium chrysogenum]|uniref:Uncharacterized protein n=1 Tax=Penicillium chrysogenum TaxID=5076 RepID=A0ABQ8WEQ2_PENCH|nr:hypothetical protein N7505_007828 [Penicillium chrysogenum]
MRVLSFVLITIIGAGYAFGREQTFPQQTFTLQEGKDSNLKIHAQGIFACTGDTVDPYSTCALIEAKDETLIRI